MIKRQTGETFTFKTSLNAILKRQISCSTTTNFELSHLNSFDRKIGKSINKSIKANSSEISTARATRSSSSFENNRVNTLGRVKSCFTIGFSAPPRARRRDQLKGLAVKFFEATGAQADAWLSISGTMGAWFFGDAASVRARVAAQGWRWCVGG